MRGKLDRNQQFKIGAVLSYLAIAINTISALIYSPWMLSKIGSGDYGLYTLAVSLINMFLLDFGISSAVSRFTSKYVAEGRQDKVNQLLGVVYKLFITIAAIISIALIVIYFFIEQIYVALTPEELERFKVVYIISATYSVVSFPFSTTLNGVLNAYEKFIPLKLCDVINKVLAVILIVMALVMGYGLYELVAINAFVNLLIFAIKFFVIKTATPVKIKLSYWDKSMLKEIFGFSIWVLINTICSRLIMNVCPNILGVTAGTAAITIFSFASTIEGYAYTFSSAIDGMFMPRIARITYQEGNMDKILELMVKVGRFQYHLVGLILVGFVCVGREFVGLWLGAEYLHVYYCAILLLLPAPFYLSQQIGKNTMVMMNKVKYLTYMNVIKAGLNVVLVAVLSVFWGVIGASISICIVYFFRNFASMYLYKHKLGIDTKKFYIQCYARMSIPMILTLLIGFFTNRVALADTWMGLIVKVAFIVIVYLVLMWLIAYNEYEKDTIRNLFKHFKKNGEEEHV